MPVALCAVFMYVRFCQKPLRVQRYNNFLIYANLFAFWDGIFGSRAVCSSMGGFQGGDDEAAESGTEMVVRFGVLGRRGMVAEMLAVVRITLFPLGTQGGVFEDG